MSVLVSRIGFSVPGTEPTAVTQLRTIIYGREGIIVIQHPEVSIRSEGLGDVQETVELEISVTEDSGFWKLKKGSTGEKDDDWEEIGQATKGTSYTNIFKKDDVIVVGSNIRSISFRVKSFDSGHVRLLVIT